MVNYSKLYGKKYGDRKYVNTKKNYFGIRKVLKRYDWDRYDMTEKNIIMGDRVLDVGCGNCSMLLRLHNKFNHLFGIDISHSQIEKGRERICQLGENEEERFHLLVANADEPLPFSDDYFDSIICISVLEHVYDVFSLVKEMHRVLKPSGYLIVQVPNIVYIRYRLMFLLGLLPATSNPHNWEHIGWDGGHIHYFNMTKFCWLFESQGFRVEKKFGSGLLAPLRYWWPSMLCGELFIKAVKY